MFHFSFVFIAVMIADISGETMQVMLAETPNPKTKSVYQKGISLFPLKELAKFLKF